jgi:endoglucanase
MKNNFLLLISLFLSITYIKAQDITVNQVGYLVDNLKLAVVPSAETGSFQVIDTTSDEVKFTGTLSAAKTWTPASQSVKIADFTAFNDTGTYRIKIEGSTTQSNVFRIAQNTFHQLSINAMRYFYLSRASMALLPAYAGVYAREAGHPDTSVIIHASAASPERPTGTRISTPRGWYDAGDYNKYVVNAGISTYTVFAIAEHFPEYASKLDLNIPESNNNVPDIIDEALYNLRWMLSMQDPNDGGVYHKCTNLYFEGMVKPKDARNPRYVVMKSTSAALNLAAVAAQASRLLRKYETDYPGLADSCLSAAIYAFQWAQAHPTQYYVQPADVSTGGYNDYSLSDEFMWAALELYITTKNELYMTEYDYASASVSNPGWATVYSLGLISLIHNQDLITSSLKLEQVKTKIINYANTSYNAFNSSAYKVPEIGFGWGSNGGVTNSAMMALQAYYLTGDKKYKDFVVASLDYLLGRNPTKYSYVTGFGTKTPMHVHDRKSESDGVAAPIPGMLVGGANPSNVTDCGVSAYPSTQPALSYLDALCSYSTNEIAINWNAPFAYIVCALQAIQEKNPKISNATTDVALDSIIIAKMDVQLDSATLQTSDFSILKNEGSVITINRVELLGNDTLLFVLDENINPTDSNIGINYTPGSLKSIYGYEVETIANYPVINMLEGSPPLLLEAYTDELDNTFFLGFSKKMNDPVSFINDFKIILPADTLTVSGASVTNTDSLLISLHPEYKPNAGDPIFIDYNGSLYTSKDNGLLKPVSGFPVKNLFYYPAFLVNANIDFGGFFVDLNFTKAILDTSIHIEDFIVSRNDNSPINIVDASFETSDKRTFNLQLQNEFMPEDTNLTVNYTGSRLKSTEMVANPLFGPIAMTNRSKGTINIPGLLQAEYFKFNDGFKLETTTDTSGEYSLAGAALNDFCDYKVNVTSGGQYTVISRLSNGSSRDGSFMLSLGDATVLDTIVIAKLDSWNTWKSVYQPITLPAGEQTIRLKALNSGFKLNWMQFEEGIVEPPTGILNCCAMPDNIAVYPNPVKTGENINIELIDNPGWTTISLYDLTGRKIQSLFEGNIRSIRTIISRAIQEDLAPAIYIVRIKGNNFNKDLKVVIQ